MCVCLWGKHCGTVARIHFDLLSITEARCLSGYRAVVDTAHCGVSIGFTMATPSESEEEEERERDGEKSGGDKEKYRI